MGFIYIYMDWYGLMWDLYGIDMGFVLDLNGECKAHTTGGRLSLSIYLWWQVKLCTLRAVRNYNQNSYTYHSFITAAIRLVIKRA